MKVIAESEPPGTSLINVSSMGLSGTVGHNSRMQQTTNSQTGDDDSTTSDDHTNCNVMHAMSYAVHELVSRNQCYSPLR